MTSGCRRRSRAASCARIATASSPAPRCSGTAPTSTARARCWPRRRTWAWACTWRWSRAVRWRTRHACHRCWRRAGGFMSRGAEFIAAWTKRRIDAGDVEREFEAQVARVREAGIRVDHLDTHHHLGFLPVVGRSVEAVAQRHGIGAIRSEIETPIAVVGDRPAARAQGGRADGPQLAHAPAARSAPAQRAELGLRGIGAARRGARAGDHRTARPGDARAHLPSGRGAVARLRPHGRVDDADVRRRCGARSASATYRCAAGGICFERRARNRRRAAGGAAAPSRTCRRRRAWPSCHVKAVALGIAFGVIFGAATVYLALKAGLTVSASIPIAVLAISLLKRLGGVDDPREQHRPDHRLGGRIDRRRRRVHPPRLPVPRRAAPAATASASRISRTGRS